MDTSTSSPLTNPTVMAQQIQAFTANVQELMKQNEELKRRAPLGLRLCCSLDAITMIMMTRPIVQRKAEGILPNIPRSQLVVVIK